LTVYSDGMVTAVQASGTLGDHQASAPRSERWEMLDGMRRMRSSTWRMWRQIRSAIVIPVFPRNLVVGRKPVAFDLRIAPSLCLIGRGIALPMLTGRRRPPYPPGTAASRLTRGVAVFVVRRCAAHSWTLRARQA